MKIPRPVVRRPVGRRSVVAPADLATLPALPGPEAEPAPEPALNGAASSVVDNALYCDGRRIAQPESLAATYALLRERSSDRRGDLAWIGLLRPQERDLTSLAAEFDLHELAVEDAVQAHQRPKLERYGETLFVVLRAARYDDRREEVDFSELHVFVGDDFVVTVRHGDAPDLASVRRRMEGDPELLALGAEAVLYAILDRVVDDYFPVVDGLGNDIDEIETEVFRGEATVSRRIYELSREVIEFQRAARPLQDIMRGLSNGFVKYSIDPELQRNLRDVQDHVEQVVERLDGFRQLLQNILTVNSALVGERQNEEIRLLSEASLAQSEETKTLTEASLAQSEEVKKISSWAAILFAPTLVGTVYGMNFVHMPELQWQFGYPLALALMLVVSVGLYSVFKRRGWL